MGYSREIYDKAFEKLSEQRKAVQKAHEERKRKIYRTLPEVLQIEQELSTTAIRVARSVLSQENAAEQLEQLKEENLSLQQSLQKLLVKNGFAPDSLLPAFFCKKCEDTGFVDNKPCDCFQRILRQTAIEQLGAVSSLNDCSFESFSLDYYPAVSIDSTGVIPREKMKEILARCVSYADSFSENSGNLLFLGSTGLGKTHLSLSIARTVIQKGYGVLYSPTQDILHQLEREQFKNGSLEGSDINQVISDCDLLILDDLGSEFQTQFTQSALYGIINTRLLLRKPTIINTNLSLAQIQDRYTERVLSRLVGGYDIFKLIGKDIRQQKKFG